MARIPLKYVLGSLVQRPVSATLTTVAYALVVLVLIGLLAMVAGIDASLVSTGRSDRFFVMDARATAENQSQLSVQDVLDIRQEPGIRLDATGDPITSNELVSTVYAVTPNGHESQLTFRGVDLTRALRVHSSVHLIAGRSFDSEQDVIAGKGALTALGLRVGDTFSARKRDWRIVGAFSDAGSPFESEIWTRRSDMQRLFDRDYLSSVWALAQTPEKARALVDRLNTDPSLSVSATTEHDYFARGGSTAEEIRLIAWFVTVIMSFGAVFGAMNTLYASISDRHRELGTLRAIGFPASAVVRAVLTEALIVAATGGLLAVLASMTLDGLTFRSIVTGVGFVTFELRITPSHLIGGVAFALLMGALGGLLPARRTVRTSVIIALKE